MHISIIPGQRDHAALRNGGSEVLFAALESCTLQVSKRDNAAP